MENFKNTLNRVSLATEEIIEFGVVSPKKRPHSEVAALPAENLFADTFKEARIGVDLNVDCLNAMEDFKYRLQVQENFNLEQRVLDRTQEIVKVQSCIGHQNEHIPPLLIQDQLVVESCKTEVLEETTLNQEEYTMVQYMNKKIGPDFIPLAKQLFEGILQQVLPHL